MRKSFILVFLAVFSFSTASHAAITNVVYNPSSPSDPVYCPLYYWYGSSDTAHMYGYQSGPGSIGGTIFTDTEVDPTLTLQNTLQNNTAFAWGAFHVNFYMNVNFVLSGAAVTIPNDWSVLVTQPFFNGTQYVGQLDCYSGTPVAINGTLDFQYDATFSGLVNFSFTQEFIPIPVPEPATPALISLGIAMLGLARRHFRGK